MKFQTEEKETWIKWMLGFSLIFQFRYRKIYRLINLNSIERFLDKSDDSIDYSPLSTKGQRSLENTT